MNTAVTTQNRVAKVHEFFHDPSRKQSLATLYTGNIEKVLSAIDIAVMKDNKIADASMESLYREVKLALNDGLKLDGKEAALTRLNVKKGDGWVTEVLYVPMVRGLMKLARNSGEIVSWSVELVRQNETVPDQDGVIRFRRVAAPVPEIFHEPMFIGDPGPVVGAYSAVKLRDGSMHYEFMTRAQLDAIKNRTKSKNREGQITGPWATDEEEMFRKTVIRRHCKRLPSASEALEAAVERVDGLYDMSPEEYQKEPEAPAPAVAKARKMSAAGALKRAAEKTAAEDVVTDDSTSDAIDGEILPPDEEPPVDDEHEF